MKKIVVVFFVLTLITMTIVSCVDQKENANKNGTGTQIDTQDVDCSINVVFGERNEDAYGKRLNRVKYAELDNWSKIIEEKFDVKIKVNYISSINESDIVSNKYYETKINSGEISGLILIEPFEYDNITYLKEKGLIYPLDEYLEGNANYEKMPQEMKEAFLMPDGQIWALPAEYSSSLYGRYIRKDWLEKLNLEMPTSLSSLFEVARAFAYNDPNGNGENDEFGMSGMLNNASAMFGDIFLASDCYLSYRFLSSIGYDYSTGAYEDAALKPEMKNALTMIKGLIDEKIVNMKPNYQFLDFNTTGTFFDLNNKDLDASKWEIVYSLIPGKEHSVLGIKPERCYIMAANTKNPSDTINAFLNVFYEDAESAALGQYGIENKNYVINGNNIQIIGDAPIELIGRLPYLGHGNLNEITLSNGETQKIASADFELYSGYSADNQLLTDLHWNITMGAKEFSTAFGQYFNRYFIEVYNSLSTEDFLAYYNKEMKKKGIQDVIDQMNEKIGAQSEYRHD